MRRFLTAALMLALPIGGVQLLGGCDRTVSEHKTVETKEDGATVTREKKVTENPNTGTVTKTEKKETNP